MSRYTTWDPERYARNARFVSELGEPVLDLLGPNAGENILDLGCGDGALTEKIASFGARVAGVDSSFAQARATKKRGLQVVVMDGQRLSFKPNFDAVFTNAALHWMREPDKVAKSVWHAMKKGGRFIGEFGGKGNIDKIRCALYDSLRVRGIDPAAVDPWYFPSEDEYAQTLTEAGFVVSYLELILRPTRLPTDIRGWLEIFAPAFSNAIPESDRPAFIQQVIERLEPELRNPDGHWFADYVRLRFKALKP